MSRGLADLELYIQFVQFLLSGIPQPGREAWMAARLPRTFVLLSLSAGWGDLGGGVGE